MSGINTQRRYTPRGSTWKPCEGCRQEKLHRIGDVCSDCARKLQAYDELVAQIEAAAVGRETYHVQRRGPLYGLPVYDPQGFFDTTELALRARGQQGPTPRDELEAAAAALAETVGELDVRPGRGYMRADERRLWTERQAQRHDWYEGTKRLYTPEQAAALDRLDRAIRVALAAAWTDGRKYGSSLLMHLANGGLSVEDFNKRTTEGAK